MFPTEIIIVNCGLIVWTNILSHVTRTVNASRLKNGLDMSAVRCSRLVCLVKMWFIRPALE